MLKDNSDRWRCKTRDCNPELYGEAAAQQHRDETGHRVNRWPVRSAEGKRRARNRNKGGYYDKYNRGPKTWAVRSEVIATQRTNGIPVEAQRHDVRTLPRHTESSAYLALLEQRDAQLDTFGWD